MTVKENGDGGTAPDARDQGTERERVYQQGRAARQLMEAGKRWVEPHYPGDESDLAQAWLDGWQDMGEELAGAGDEKGGAA